MVENFELSIPKIQQSAINILFRKNIIFNFQDFLFKNKNIRIQDTILIIGSPRSGTTWLMEIIGNIPGYTYLYEPLQPVWFPDSLKAGFKTRGSLPNEKYITKQKKYLSEIFTGEKISNFPFYRLNLSTIMNFLLSKKLIVKSIRLNRMIPWIYDNFPLRKILFITRHPCAVIASQLKTGWCGYHSEFSPEINIIPTKKDIINEVIEMFEINQSLLNKIKNIDSQEEILAVAWCLDNYHLINYKKSIPFLKISYEKLYSNYNTEIKNIFNQIGEKTPKNAFKHSRIPTLVTTKEDSKLLLNITQNLSKWKNQLSVKQINRILKIVNDFGFNFVSDDIKLIF